ELLLLRPESPKLPLLPSPVLGSPPAAGASPPGCPAPPPGTLVGETGEGPLGTSLGSLGLPGVTVTAGSHVCGIIEIRRPIEVSASVPVILNAPVTGT